MYLNPVGQNGAYSAATTTNSRTVQAFNRVSDKLLFKIYREQRRVAAGNATDKYQRPLTLEASGIALLPGPAVVNHVRTYTIYFH